MSVTSRGSSHDQNPPRRPKLASAPAEPQKKPMTKAAMRRFYGTPEFHYIQTCTHDIKRKGMCSFCKIIETEAVQYLKEEEVKKNTQRLHGFYRRAEMRYGLIRDWSKNQLYRHKDSMLTHCAEIVLCSRVGDCIGHFNDINKALDDIAQNLRKRIRVMEVGNFAAILIQAHIRGHLTRKKMRHYMLTRFQFCAANSRRKAYYLDHEKGSRWKTAPALIKNERAVSPNTMARRLRAEEKKCDQHMIQYENACKRNESYLHTKRGGLWQVLEEDATMLRQMIILRDIIYCVLHRLSTKRRENGERPTNKQSILPVGGPKGPHPSQVQPPATARDNDDIFASDNSAPNADAFTDEEVVVKNPKKLLKKRSNRYKRGESTGDGLQSPVKRVTTEAEDDDESSKPISYDYSKHLTDIKPSMSAFPYWFSFSNPAPPTRQIYLTLAIKTPPLQKEVIVELSPAEIQAKLKAEKASKVVITAEGLAASKKKGGTKSNQGAVADLDEGAEDEAEEEKSSMTEDERERLEKKKNPNVLTLNERFQFLDKRIWNQMICFDAEDILRKISLCEDVHPSVNSGVGIAEDIHRVWCGDIERGGDIPGIKSRGLRVIGDSDDESSIQYSATDTESEGDESDNPSTASGKQKDKNSNNNEMEDNVNSTEGSIIPIQLQIHPFYVKRSPSNMFRLFFIKGKLRAVCHTSPWTYYSEMYTYRASMVKAIANYSRSVPCIELLKAIKAQSIEKISKKESNVTKQTKHFLATMPTLTRMSLTSTDNDEDKAKGTCMSIRLPDEKVLFDGIPEMKGCELTSKEYQRVEKKYKFVRKMFSWKKYKRNTKRHVDLVSIQAETPVLTTAELVRQESLSTHHAGEVHDKRLTLMPPAEELMGTTIYKLCCAEVPQSTLSAAAKQKLVDYKGAAGYRSLLKFNANSGETLMEHCIALPEVNAACEDLKSEVPPHPTFDLIVLDIHLRNIRAEEEEAQRKLEEEMGIPPPSTGDKADSPKQNDSTRRSSPLKGGRLPPMKEKSTTAATTTHNNNRSTTGGVGSRKKEKQNKHVKVPLIEMKVEVQQVVGTFSTSADRAPAALDTGMFEWSELKEFGAPPPVVIPTEESDKEKEEKPPAEEMTAFQIALLEKQRKTVPVWKVLSKSSGSGIYAYNVAMTTARTQQAAPDDKHMIEFRLLGKRPTREYLQSVVPLKVRKWLGMKY